MSEPAFTTAQRVAAASVHVYTSVGVILALMMVHLAYADEVTWVLWLFLVAMIVDGTDGFLARYFQVKTVLPGFDGALLDNIVDYITYAFAPMVLLWSAGYLPQGWLGAVVASIPLLASCYQFCRTDAKTEDHLFLGFPSYWNIAAFYLIVLDASVLMTSLLLLALAVMVFVPIGYVYPSRTETAWQLTMALTVVWFGLYAVLLVQYPQVSGWAVVLSTVYVVYYFGLSLRLTFVSRQRARQSALT